MQISDGENPFNNWWLHMAAAGLAALEVVAGVGGVEGVEIWIVQIFQSDVNLN